MQKTFCNLCGKEIQYKELVGGVMRSKEQFPLMPMGQPGQPSAMVEKKIVQEVWDLCAECTGVVWGAIKIRQEKLRLKTTELNKEKKDEEVKSSLIKS